MELKWLKVKVFFGKLWSFLKLYGIQIGLLLITLYVVIVLRKKDSAINDLIAEQERVQKAHEANIAQLEAQITAELQRQQEIQRQYDALINKIKTEHDANVQRIAVTNAAEIKSIIARNQQNPEAMAAALNQIFGIQVVEIKEVP
jgi:DNA anti-recombination protein RmuC